MSTSFVDATNLVIIYGGIPIFITGVIGGFLNLLVFVSLRTFRQNSCAFYLTIMSILNVGQLLTGLLSRIMIALIGIDGTETSLFYCKFRQYCSQICLITSLTCFSLATFDQYCATCSYVRWQQFCNIKLARRLVIINIIIWILHGIPYPIYYNHIQSSITKTITCAITNFIFVQYRNYIILLVFSGFLPVIITALFGWKAYRNVRQLAHRTVPIARHELEKQLTVMVLVQVIVNIFTLLPFPIMSAVSINKNFINDPIIRAKFDFVVTVTLIIYYLYFASPFYIYICASERFRRQLIYVLSKIHINQWRQPTINLNQVTPAT